MENKPEPARLELDKGALDHLAVARKWSMFLARLGFAFLVLLIIIGIATGAFLSVFSSGAEGIGIPGALLIFLVLLMTVFYVLPVIFLYRFSRNMERAIKLNDRNELSKSFKNLKSYFIYLGVLVIVLITMYILIIGVGGALMAFLKIL